MKERPILFSAPMVRALLAGTKTQTRRVAPISDIGLKTHDNGTVTWGVRFTKPVKGVLSSHSGGPLTELQARNIIGSMFCPYGHPGDRLWVREAFAKIDGQTQPWIETDYRATYKHGDRLGDSLGIKKRWTPSIHMPRAASRITLEVTEVRVERLQDISEGDALAEGVKHSLHLPGGRFANENYAHLWDTINGDGAWTANPWVWAVSFKRVTS